MTRRKSSLAYKTNNRNANPQSRTNSFLPIKDNNASMGKELNLYFDIFLDRCPLGNLKLMKTAQI